MKYFFIIVLFIVSFNVESKLLKPEKESEVKLQCLNSYIKNPFVLKIANGNIFSDEFWPFLKEIDSYCSCEDNVIKKDIEEKKSDWIQYAFKDKSSILRKRDACAIKNFSKLNLKLHYRARFVQWFSPQIFEKIKDTNVQGMERFLSENKYYNYMTCFHDEISKECSKVESLAITYSCIKDNFQIDNYYKNYNKCQRFLYEDNDLREVFEFSKENII